MTKVFKKGYERVMYVQTIFTVAQNILGMHCVSNYHHFQYPLQTTHDHSV